MIALLCILVGHLPWVVGRFQNVTRSKDSICTDIRRRFNGILIIMATDPDAGFSTAAFLYVINHIIYANTNNLLPWVSFHPTSTGPIFSSTDSRRPDDLKLLLRSSSEIGCKTDGEPNLPSPVTRATTTLDNATTLFPLSLMSPHGLWEEYFYPVSVYRPDLNCPMNHFYIPQRCVYPGIHHVADWAVRCWKYLERDLDVFDESWYRSNRIIGSKIVEKYIRPLPSIRNATEELYFQINEHVLML